MKIEYLDHVNLRTTQLDSMIDWYIDVLGLRKGERPNFPFPGVWMYADKKAVVHIIGIEGEPGLGSEVELKLEHFAFSAVGRKEFELKLNEMEMEYKLIEISSINVMQVNIWDPDGNHIHIDFPIRE